MAVMNKYKTFQKTDLGIGMGGGSQMHEPPSSISDSLDVQPATQPQQPVQKLTKQDFMNMMKQENGEL